MVRANRLPLISYVLAAACLFATPLHAQNEPPTVLVVLRNQPARTIAERIRSAYGPQRKAVADDAKLLLAQLHTESRATSEEIGAAIAPEQEMMASRLTGLGATGIRRYTVLNMIEARIPDTSLAFVQQDESVAAVIPVGSHQKLLDQIEQGLRDPRGLNVAVLDTADEPFARLIDRIVDEREALIAAASNAGPLNTIPPGSYSLDQLAGLLTFAHLPVKATQLNHTPNFISDSVSSANPFRLYAGRAPARFESTLVWDRHFDNSFQPYARNLDLLLYGQSDGAQLASSAARSGNVKQAGFADGGDLVLKVKLGSAGDDTGGDEPFAVALSGKGFTAAAGPKLGVRCSPDCIVGNEGDLPAYDVIARAGDKEIKLGTIPASSSASFMHQDGVVTVTSRSFGETFTASSGPPADPCSTGQWIIGPVSQIGGAGSPAITVSVAPPPGATCTWQVWPGPSPYFLYPMTNSTPAGAPITGPGSVSVSADPWNLPTSRTGHVVIASADLLISYWGFQVTQTGSAPPPCQYTVTLTGGPGYTYTGGSGSVNVQSQNGCASSVASNSSWATFTGSTTGTNNWSAPFTVAPNPVQPNQSTAARSPAATLTVTGSNSFSSQLTITESGLSCSYTPGTLTLPAAGIPQSQPLTLSLTTNTGCQWTATQDPTFVHPIQTGNGIYTNSGAIQYWADPNNTGTARPGYVHAGDQTGSAIQGFILLENTFDIGGPLILPAGFDPDYVVIHTAEGFMTSGQDAAIDPVSRTWSAKKLDAGKSYFVFTQDISGYTWEPINYLNVGINTANKDALPFKLVPNKNPLMVHVKVVVWDARGVPIEGASLSFNSTPDCSKIDPGHTDSTGLWTYRIFKDCKYTVQVAGPAGNSYDPNQLPMDKEHVNVLFRSNNYQATGRIKLAVGPLAQNADQVKALFVNLKMTFTSNPKVNAPPPAGFTQGTPVQEGGKNGPWVIVWHQQGLVLTSGNASVEYWVTPDNGTMTFSPRGPQGIKNGIAPELTATVPAK